MQRAPFSVIICLFTIQAFLRFRSDLVSDAAWYLYVADGLLHGKQLYVDFIEVNPPLATWFMVPIVWFASALKVSSVSTLYVALLALTAASLALVNRSLRLSAVLPDHARQWLIVAVAAVMLFAPAGDYAEREHFIVLLFMPWLFFRFARYQGAKSLRSEAVVVGVLGALAICIKPQSLVAPLAVELYFVLRYRRWREVVSVENVAAVVVALAYAALLILTQHEFMTLVINLGVKAYIPFYGYPPEIIWVGAALTAFLIVLTFLLLREAEGPMRDLSTACAVCTGGFLLAYFIQYKGFSYQLLTAFAFAGVSCAASAAAMLAAPKATGTMSRNALLYAAVAAALFYVVKTPQACVCDQRISAAMVKTYAPQAKSIYIASVRVGAAFPLVVNENLIWASRLPASWLTPYVSANWKNGPLPADEIVRLALDWSIADLNIFRPDIIFIDQSAEQLQVKGGYFDYFKLWSQDSRFAALWSGYEARGNANGFAIYTRK